MAAYVLVAPCYSGDGSNPAAGGNAGAQVPCDQSQPDCVDNAGVPCTLQGQPDSVITASGYPLTGVNAPGAPGTPAAIASQTGSLSAGSAANNGGSSLVSTLTSLGSIGVQAYSAAQPAPVSSIKTGAFNLQVPTGSSTLVIVGVVAIAALFLFSRKKG